METFPTPTNLLPTSSSSSLIAPTLFSPPAECLSAAIPNSSSGIIRANTLWITQTVGCVNTNIADTFLDLTDCCGPFDTEGIVVRGEGQICPVGYAAHDASVYGSKTTAACCPSGFTAVFPNLFCGNTESQTVKPTNGLTTVIVTSAFVLQAVWDAKVTSVLGTTAAFSFSSASAPNSSSSSTTAAAVSTATQTTTLLSDPKAGSRFTVGLIGGVVGFVVFSWVVMAFVLACWYQHRKRKRQERMTRSWVNGSQTHFIQDAAPPGNIPEWRWSFGKDPKQIGVAHGDPSDASSHDYGRREKGESIELTRTMPDYLKPYNLERSLWRPEVVRKPVAAMHQRNTSSLSEGRSGNTSGLSEVRSKHELTPEDAWRPNRHYRTNSTPSERRRRRELISEDAWWADLDDVHRNNSRHSVRTRRELSPGDNRRVENSRREKSDSSVSSSQSQSRRETTPDDVRKPERGRHQRNASSISDPWQRAELTPVLEDPGRTIRF